MTSTQWLEVLVSFSLQVLVVVGAGRLLERRVQTSTDRCRVWNGCFLAILVLGCAALLLPRYHAVHPWSSVDSHKLLTISSVQGVVGSLLLVAWGIGAMATALKWIVGELLLRRSLRRCRTLSADHTRLLLKDISHTNADKLPTILVSDENYGPCCWQFDRPTILLPEFLLDDNPTELRQVLMHEMAHFQTNHPLHLFFQHLVQIVCWFHPSVWTAACHASLAREYACDDAATRDAKTCAVYLRTLLHIAERQCGPNGVRQAMGFGRARSEIVLRAQRLARATSNSASHHRRLLIGSKRAAWSVVLMTCLLSQAWIPLDSMSSSRSNWSPWPKWTSEAAHCFGFSLRDYEQFDRRVQPYEILYDDDSA